MPARPRRFTAGRRDMLKAMARKGWSQQDLARKLKREPAIVSRLVSADRLPSLELAIEIEALLEVSPRRWLKEVPPDDDAREPATGTDGR